MKQVQTHRHTALMRCQSELRVARHRLLEHKNPQEIRALSFGCSIGDEAAFLCPTFLGAATLLELTENDCFPHRRDGVIGDRTAPQPTRHERPLWRHFPDVGLARPHLRQRYSWAAGRIEAGSSDRCLRVSVDSGYYDGSTNNGQRKSHCFRVRRAPGGSGRLILRAPR